MDPLLLKEAGLTEGESKVYLALLELGTTTTGPLTDKAKVAKSIIYPLLEKLIEKGLASYIIKEKTKYFQAAEPNKLLEYIEERKVKLEKNKLKVEELLPQLLLLQKSAPATNISIYEGFKGVQTCFDHYKLVLKKGDAMYSYGVIAQQEEKYHSYWKRHHLIREKEGIYSYMLFDQGTPKEVMKNRNSFWGCESRYMPTKIQTSAWILVYKNTAAIFLQSGHLAIEIINQEIADTFKAYFDEYWEQSAPFK